MNPLKKLASQTAVYGASHIIGRFINYLLVPLHTATFATAEYGINNLMYSYVTFFNVLLTYGMETAFFRYAQKHDKPDEVYSTGLSSLIGSSSVFVLLGLLFASPIAQTIGIGAHPEYVIYFVLIIAFDAVCALPFAYLRQQNKALKFALVKNLSIFINILLNLYFLLVCPYVFNKHQIQLPLYTGKMDVGYIFLANLIASVITIPLLLSEFLAITKARFNKTLWRQLMVYGLPLMVVGFAGMINEALDRIILSYMYTDAQKGLEATGIYGANYKLAILMTLFIQAFRYAAEPFFFNHAKTSDKRDIYGHVMNYFVLVCLGLFLVVTLYIDVFKHFIDSRYWEGLKVVPVLLMANLFLGVYYNLSVWYKLSDKTNVGAVISLIGAGITIAANFALIPILGYEGSAWATLICYFSMVVISYFLGNKYYPIPYQVKQLSAYISLALLLFFTQQLLIKKLLTDSVFHHVSAALFILLFAGIAFLAERKQLSQLFSRG